ncbi:TPR-like protein [Wallemia mellicola]|uniref:Pre-mRNA-splicing factor SYF1 n=1 Tax=Wallemia mellicola TaxID=1708541 RepID=A0AB74KFK6_9BASI|nr:TPR-like protein [Wallemia mellicola]
MDVEEQVIDKLNGGISLRDELIELEYNNFDKFTSKFKQLGQSNDELKSQYNQLIANYNEYNKTNSLAVDYEELSILKSYNEWLLDLIVFSHMLDDLVVNFSPDKYQAVRDTELELLGKYKNDYISKLKENSFNRIVNALSGKLSDDLQQFGYPNNEIKPLDLSVYPNFSHNWHALDDFDKVTSKIDNCSYKALVIQSLINPIKLRFTYHFDSDSYTNKLTKPEFYLNFITSSIIKHKRFVSSEIQHLSPTTDTLSTFVDQIAYLAKDKFTRSIPALLDNANLLTHTVHHCLKFDHFIHSNSLSTSTNITNDFLNNNEWFNSWLDSETKLANQTFQTIISSKDAWSFIHQRSSQGDDSDDDLSLENKPSVNCTVSAQRILDLIETITDRYKPLPALHQQASFMIKVQLPLIEKYGSKLTMSLDAFESYSSTFIAAMSSVPGSFGEKHKSDQDDTLGSSTLTKLIKIITNSQHFSSKISEWGEEPFFLELWEHFTRVSSQGSFEKTIFSELSTMFITLAQRAQGILVSHTTSSVMLSFNEYLKSRLWNLEVQADKNEYNQELTRSYSILKHHLDNIHEKLFSGSKLITKVLIKQISYSVKGSIEESILGLRQQFSQSSSQQLLNDVLKFTQLNTYHAEITFKAFIPVIDQLILLSLPTKATEDDFKDRTLSKAMQFAWEDASEPYKKWCRQTQLSDLSLVGCMGDFNEREFTVDQLKAQRLLRMRNDHHRIRERMTIDELKDIFPLTKPLPTPSNNKSIAKVIDLQFEEELSRNPTNLRTWFSYIDVIQSKLDILTPIDDDDNLDIVLKEILGPLATEDRRSIYQTLTSIYERALAMFPLNYRLWFNYLLMRLSFLTGNITAADISQLKNTRRRLVKGQPIVDLEKGDERIPWKEVSESNYLDGIVGESEWKATAAVFERCLSWMPSMPRLWILYLSLLSNPACPSRLAHTHARRTFDRALRTLPPSLHVRIWPSYLNWAKSIGGNCLTIVWRRYLAVDPYPIETYIQLLLNGEQASSRALEACKLLLKLSRLSRENHYVSPQGKSPYMLLNDWLEVCSEYADVIGVDVDQATALKPLQVGGKQNEMDRTEGTSSDQLVKSTIDSSADADIDPSSSQKLDVDSLVRQDGLSIYKDQAGRLWTGLATYWIRRGEFDKAREVFETAIDSVVTVRDFTQVFDAYAEFNEQLVTSLMDALADIEDEEKDDLEKELDDNMQSFEGLMDRRPFLVNDVMLRRNPNDVNEWQKRVALFDNNDEKIVETYTQAISTIKPKQAVGFGDLYANFAKYYESKGDLDSSRQIFEKASAVHYRRIDELAEIWIQWSEMELRHDNFEEAISVMQRATVIPKNTKVDYYDESIAPQRRLFKSLKLWSFYVDIEESIGTTESTKKVYDKIMDLKIANAQVIINYALFLEENDYFDDSFKVYERGVDAFTYPVAFELWNVYLSKFLKRYVGSFIMVDFANERTQGGSKIELARDLFEQAIEGMPSKFAKPIYLMYGKLEEEYGLAKRAIRVYERATQAVSDKDKFEMYKILIAKVAMNFGMAATRPVYEKSLEELPDKAAIVMGLRFANLERKLGEVDRARSIYAHTSQYCDPRIHKDFWEEWNQFEIDHGSEDTFREFLRIRRSVQASFNTEAHYLAAQSLHTNKDKESEDEEAVNADPMANVERAIPGFVKGQTQAKVGADDENEYENAEEATNNQDEIEIDEEDM